MSYEPILAPALAWALAQGALVADPTARQEPPAVAAPAAPATTEPTPEPTVDGVLARGVAILLALQEAHEPETPVGEWPYEGVYRERGQIPIGYRVGGTAIAASALCEAPGFAADEPRRAAVERALSFVLGALEEPAMAAGFAEGYDVRGWGHAYALDFLLRLRASERVDAERRAQVDRAVAELVRALETTALPGGGWNYARGRDPSPSTFMTAATLQALFLARAQGEAVDAEVVERALDALDAARLETGAFQYATRATKTGQGFEDVRGAIGRMPICETTLLLAGRGELARVRAALAAFFEHWQFLEDRRKQTGTHAPPYMIAPYYFFFAHRYAAQAIEQLDPAEREPLRARLRGLLWKVREASGGFNDRVFPRSEGFGTAMTLLALCEPGAAPPAGWRAPRETED